MKRNVNLGSSIPVCVRTFPDNGKPIVLNVDNFPADNPAYKKSNGFRCNDISLLDRLSFDMNVDSDLVKIVASRVKEIKQSDDYSDLSEQQMKKLCRPSYVQTQAEIKAWDEYVFNEMTTTMDLSPDEVKDVSEKANSQQVVQPESLQNDDIPKSE